MFFETCPATDNPYVISCPLPGNGQLLTCPVQIWQAVQIWHDGAMSEVDEVRTRLYIFKTVCFAININPSFFIVDGENLYPRL